MGAHPNLLDGRASPGPGVQKSKSEADSARVHLLNLRVQLLLATWLNEFKSFKAERISNTE